MSYVHRACTLHVYSLLYKKQLGLHTLDTTLNVNTAPIHPSYKPLLCFALSVKVKFGSQLLKLAL